MKEGILNATDVIAAAAAGQPTAASALITE